MLSLSNIFKNITLKQTSSAATMDNGKSNRNYKVGETIVFQDIKVTVTSIEHLTEIEGEFGAYTPKKDKEYLKVNLEIINTSTSRFHIDTLGNWKIQDNNGIIRGYDHITSEIDDGLRPVELAEGGKITGALIFEVPANDNGLILLYDHSPFSESPQTTQIKL